MKYTSSSTRNKISGTDSRHRGFTLVEMIVALGIFAVVAVVALGALVKIVSANKKAQNLQSAITNLNFGLESMSRELRVGSKFTCIQGEDISASTFNQSTACPGLSPVTGASGAILAFKSSEKSNINGSCSLIYAYRFILNPDGVTYDFQKARQSTCTDTTYALTFAPITDPNLVITDYSINVDKAGVDQYPIATVRVSGYAGVREREKSYFDIQTAISARIQ